jgi:hypothetical protein
LGIDDIDRRAGGIGVDLVEDVRELELVLLGGEVAGVGSADDVVEREQRVASIAKWLVLVYIDGGPFRDGRRGERSRALLVRSAGPGSC